MDDVLELVLEPGRDSGTLPGERLGALLGLVTVLALLAVGLVFTVLIGGLIPGASGGAPPPGRHPHDAVGPRLPGEHGGLDHAARRLISPQCRRSVVSKKTSSTASHS